MSELSKDEINCDLFNEVKELKARIKTLEAEKGALYKIIYHQLNWTDEDIDLSIEEELTEAQE